MCYVWDIVETIKIGVEHTTIPELRKKGYSNVLLLGVMWTCFFDIHGFAHETHMIYLSIGLIV